MLFLFVFWESVYKAHIHQAFLLLLLLRLALYFSSIKLMLLPPFVLQSHFTFFDISIYIYMHSYFKPACFNCTSTRTHAHTRTRAHAHTHTQNRIIKLLLGLRWMKLWMRTSPPNPSPHHSVKPISCCGMLHVEYKVYLKLEKKSE